MAVRARRPATRVTKVPLAVGRLPCQAVSGRPTVDASEPQRCQGGRDASLAVRVPLCQWRPEGVGSGLRSGLPDLLRDSSDENDAPPAADGSFVTRLHGDIAFRDVTVPIRISTGVAHNERNRTIIPVRWCAAYAEHMFPDFEGTIEIEPQSRTTAQVTLTGAYRPPLGPVGAALDAVALEGVAHQTADRLVAELAKRLSRAAKASVVDHRQPSGQSAPRLAVGDVMTADPVVLAEQTSIRSAAQILIVHGISGAPVVSPAGVLVGVLSESDLLDKETPPAGGRHGRESARRHRARTVGEACTRPAFVTSPDTGLHDAAALMRAKRASRLVVVSGSEITGVVTRHDVLKALCRTDAELQAAVDAVVADTDQPNVEAIVDWSIVRVHGHCALHSVADRIVAGIEGVDGVVGVDAELTWAVDDLAPVPMM
jgi:CBS domain-containing protein